MLDVQRWTEVSKDASHQTNTASGRASPEWPANRPAVTHEPAQARAAPNCPQTSAPSDEGTSAAASRSEPPASPRDSSTRQSYLDRPHGAPSSCWEVMAPTRIRRTAGCTVQRLSGLALRPGPAGNQVGITGARKCAVPLGSAHLCAGLICGNMGTAWWRGCGCIPGGQGVAGSNPAVPTGS
jgi:hypothetical protein